ncbi:MAG: hypothetical protein AAGA30_10845 [Planctomycetota bacterium]
MSKYRFQLEDRVMCNLGSKGWKLGRVIAIDYREEHWESDKFAPYQVMLELDHVLIYVPEDDDSYCRSATSEDLKISLRRDALAILPPGITEPAESSTKADSHPQLHCSNDETTGRFSSYRTGECMGCNSCPQDWLYVEFFSEHYRCVERNELKATRHTIDLGTVCVGGTINYATDEHLDCQVGFMQCPTLVRLPPGVHFHDDGSLTGTIEFDPQRDANYEVEFVAVSADQWDDTATGIVRLEINMKVEGNEPPFEFDLVGFEKQQQRARELASVSYRKLGETWERWELGQLDNPSTCSQMLTELGQLRSILEQYPRLDHGWWWAQLGGYHMNVHKLLENTLFECELYLGYALTFGDAEVRWLAEQNLKGCFQKRLLEAARFLWISGVKQMLQDQWEQAAETLRESAAKCDGWGWAINFGDIWFTESAARLIHGVQLSIDESTEHDEGHALMWMDEANRLLDRGIKRTSEADYFGPQGHPWAKEIGEAIASYREILQRGGDQSDWLRQFKSRTAYWCAQVLSGAPPFPPAVRPRREDALDLIQRLPGHHCQTNTD